MNEELMNMVLEAGTETLSEKLVWFCHKNGIDISALTAEHVEAFVSSVWDQFADTAALYYSLHAAGLML